MKIHLLALFFVISLTAPAWARLGETEAQLIARYGDVIGKDHIAAGVGQVAVAVDRLHFKKSGFDISVALFNGVSAKEEIANKQGDMLTDQEIKTLLDANAQGHTWKGVTGPNGFPLWPQDNGMVVNANGKMWQRDDAAVAIADGGGFTIKSKELIDAEIAAYKAAHVHSLEGF